MSLEGVQLAASVFSAMQQARERLLRMATSPVGDGQQKAATLGGRQDLLLARMFEVGNDAMKNLFMAAVTPPGMPERKGTGDRGGGRAQSRR